MHVKTLRHTAAAALLLAAAVLSQAQTIVRAAVTPDAELLNAVRKCKVISADYPLRVSKSGTEVYVTTLIDPKTTDKDRKIDAVMVAKAVMDADKSVLISHFRLKRRMADREFEAVVVKQSDVKAYGTRAIDVNSLLGQLKVVQRTMSRKQ